MEMCLASSVHLVEAEEGCRLKAYPDSLGVWTIGRGYNLIAHGYNEETAKGMEWTQEQADTEFINSIERVVKALDDTWPKWRTLDEVRQAVCVSSVYQLGSAKAQKFVATIDAMEDHDWNRAAAQIRASRWAKQTPARANRNAEMLISGKWPVAVNGTAFDPDKGMNYGIVLDDRGVIVSESHSAQIQSGASVLPASGHKDSNVDGESHSTDMGKDDLFTCCDTVKKDKQTATFDGLTIAGLRISKKMVVTIGGVILLALNKQLNLDLGPDVISAVQNIVMAYVVSQAGADILGPQAAPLVDALKKRFNL